MTTSKSGRKALTDVGVIRILRSDIPPTIRVVSQLSSIPEYELVPLGSVGKQDTSGDIDLAVNVNIFDPKTIHEKMLEHVAGIYNVGNRIGSYAVPIKGDQRNGFVQVDLMYVQNTKWAEFAYHSPGESSKYKGAIRNILLAAAAATLNEPGVDAFVYEETGNLIARAGRGFNPNIGIKRMNQLRGKHKTKGTWLKTMKNVKPENIKAEFPDLVFDESDTIVDDPSKAVQILFGDGVTVDGVTSAERIIELAKTFPKERGMKFFEHAAKRAAPLVGKMEIPPEIQEQME